MHIKRETGQHGNKEIVTLSLRKIFRFVFVIFSLYLMGDAFYRWDGARYYASFLEFLPGLSLAFILWSLVAAFVALIVWLPVRLSAGIFRLTGVNITEEVILVAVFVCMFLAGAVWLGGRVHVPYVAQLAKWKTAFLSAAVILSILITWMVRNRAGDLLKLVQERITPLIWLFGVFFVISVPLVAYHSMLKGTDEAVSRSISQTAGKDLKRTNIILVTFDALTARDMSVYGYDRKTTPFISEWAESASLFRRAEAESLITTPTTASLMTGKRLWTHQTYHIAGSSKPVKSEIESMPLVLKKNGYYNMAFVVNPFASVRKLGIAGSFDVAPIETGFSKQANLLGIVDGFLYRCFGNKIQLYNWLVQRDFILFRVLNKLSRNVSKTTAPPEKAFNEFLMVLDSKPPEPFFSWIHLYPPHDPYLPPEPFMGTFDSLPGLRTYKSQDDAVHRAAQYFSRYDEFPPEIKPDVDTLRARYDEFIRYCDQQFEMLISQLRERGILDNTIVILSSDHGESFEHNYIKHSFNNLYEQVTHIPLIIKEPEQLKGRVIDVVVEQIDIPATILDAAGIPVPEWMEGRSLVPLMRGNSLPARPAFSMALEGQASRGHRITKGRIAVWEGDYKLIHFLEEKKNMLFNLRTDPGERNNLFEEEAETGRNLLGLIRDNLKMANDRIAREQ